MKKIIICKTRVYKQPATRFECSKKEKFEKKYENIIKYKKNISKNFIFFKILKNY